MSHTVPARRIFPASLMVEDRSCVVVGGGKVALHKTHLLVEAGARVRVIAPAPGAEWRSLVEAGAVTLTEQAFAEAALEGAFLVFAATNDKAVNRHILEACRRRHILCCCVDGNWTAGDFVTPAVFRKHDLTVSISTGGQSCRRSRLVKDNLSRHVELVESADLLVLGTSHHQLPLERREPLHLVGRKLDRMGQMLTQVWGVHEFLLLNTCNRVELIAIVTRDADVGTLLSRILGFDRLTEEEYYVKRGFGAFEHVAVLTAGLFSQTPGENHIVAQMKEALDHSVQAGWAQGMMQEWMAAALHVSKDIRSESGVLLKAFEIEDVGLNYLRAELPDFAHRHVLVLGTGVVGTGMVKRLLAAGVSVRWCYHIHKPEVPADWQPRVRLCTFDELREQLGWADVVVGATDSPHYVLHTEHVAFFKSEKRVAVLDMSMPRNIAPDLHGARPGLTVADLEDLKHWYRREQADMEAILALSNKTVNAHADLYAKIVRAFQSGPAAA